MYDLFLAADSNFKRKKGQAQSVGNLIAILFFLIIFAFFIGLIAGKPVTLLNPVSVISIILLIGVGIAAGNTPVARGAAIAAAVTVLFATFFIDFAALGVPLTIFGILIAPLMIVFMFIWLESSKS